MSLHTETISSLRRRLTAGEISPADILDDLAAAIETVNPRVGAYLSHDLAAAKAEAARADLTQALGGIPIGLKDNINTLGQSCSCGSKILSGHYTSPYDATVVSRLRAAGAIPFGRLNMDEFAMGSSTENSALQTTRNPHDLNHIPGGSSGGSAAAVASQTAIAALGSDTGGSIRQPASHCGVVGLKPTYGRVSRYGLVAFASSLDQIGPLTSTVEDAALVLQAIAGHDPRDSTSLPVATDDYLAALHQGVKGLKLGIPKEYFADGIDAEVRKLVDTAIAGLKAAGAEIVEISLPHTEHAVAAYYIIAPAEASSNLSRFDGIRYGHRTAKPDDILDLYKRSREEGFGPEVKRRIILGTYVLSSGYYDAYYTRAQKVRTLIRRDFETAFETVHAILTPVAPTAARRLSRIKDFPEELQQQPGMDTAATIMGMSADPLQEYLSDIFTIPANLAGLPAISVPIGTVASDTNSQLPVGLQIIGPHLGEATLLRVAQAAEQASA
jgi:aspartyl-tRNA(Asn)/glutamyl-tRNA(Gln) amidotransferase subunit A